MKTITHYELYQKHPCFHDHSGVHFLRCEDGSVRIIDIIGETKDGKSSHALPIYEIRWEHRVLSPEAWASIVCSVSKSGETAENWQYITSFHNGTKQQP